jgi:hypothetical protein
MLGVVVLAVACSSDSASESATTTTLPPPRPLGALPRDIEGSIAVVAGDDAGYVIEQGGRRRLFRVDLAGQISELASLDVQGVVAATWFAGQILVFSRECLEPSDAEACVGTTVAEMTRVAPDGHVIGRTEVGRWEGPGDGSEAVLPVGSGPDSYWVSTDRITEVDTDGRVRARFEYHRDGGELCVIDGRFWDVATPSPREEPTTAPVTIGPSVGPETSDYVVLQRHSGRWERLDGSEHSVRTPGPQSAFCRDGRYEVADAGETPVEVWTPRDGWTPLRNATPGSAHQHSSTRARYVVDDEFRLLVWVASGTTEPTGITFEPQAGEGRPSGLHVDDAGDTVIGCVTTGDPSGSELSCKVTR